MHRKPLHILLLILFISGAGADTILAQTDENGIDIRDEIENRLLTIQGNSQVITTNTLSDRMRYHNVPGGWHNYPEQAAAGLWTTPTDIAKWIIEIQNTLNGSQGKVLSGRTVLEMLTPDIGGWGLGPAVGGEESSLYFTHSGSNEGFICFMIAFAEIGQGAVIMTNSDNGSQLIVEILRTIAYHHNWPAISF